MPPRIVHSSSPAENAAGHRDDAHRDVLASEYPLSLVGEQNSICEAQNLLSSCESPSRQGYLHQGLSAASRRGQADGIRPVGEGFNGLLDAP